MAMRRQPTMDSGIPDEHEQRVPGSPFGMDAGAGPRTDEFGNEIPDFPRDQYPVPFEDYQPDAIAGDRTSGREMFDHRETTPPTTSGLPRGMTVQGEEGYGDGGQDSMGTPAQGFSPQPVSGMRANPSMTQRVGHGGASSALFSEASGGTPLFGRAGGLMGGGKGVLGMDDGAPSPTEMMLKLVRAFQNGGM